MGRDNVSGKSQQGILSSFIVGHVDQFLKNEQNIARNDCARLAALSAFTELRNTSEEAQKITALTKVHMQG
jgi:hypothetical protein